MKQMFDSSAKFGISTTPEEVIANNLEYQSLLNDPINWQCIPLLNYTPQHELKDMSLVRFRGMIQDMLDPEIYLERYEVCDRNGSNIKVVEGKYRDCINLEQGEEIDYDSKNNVHGERRTFFLVSIPGINSWTIDFETNCNEKSRQQIAESPPHVSQNENSKKRSVTEEMETAEKESVISPNKRRCDDSNPANETSTSGGLGREYLLNSPIPERPGKACMVKIYSDFDSYTLNSIVDVIGFLSVDPTLDASTMECERADEFGNISEIQAQNPPPSLIPRLHAISVHRLEHANPLLDERLQRPDSLQQAPINMASIQKDLRILLKLCLFGDELAADYLLSHLISTIYNRSDLETIGKFTLNLCNIPSNSLGDEYTSQLYRILERLIPASHYLPMSLENMNSVQFIPKKDYETNKLVSGILQLAPQTHLVLDETRMHQGKLEANGILGIQNLAHLIRQQQIKCNFHFYEIDYNTDVPVLILSEGKSMLPNDFILPLEADADAIQHIDEAIKAANHFLQPARLELFRRYLTEAKIKKFTMNPSDTEMIQSDFVEMRKENSIKGADELHSLLVLSRLLSIARGLEVLDKESWQLAKQIESQRKERVFQMPKSNRPSRFST